jgi:soluble lytic murein transglycosylase
MRRWLSVLLFIAGMAAGEGVAAAASNASINNGDDFLALRDAFAKGNAAVVERLAPKFSGTLLEPYAEYYRLRMRLDTAGVAEIKAYLARPADTPLVDRLRSDWLKSLGGKQQWETFDQEYPQVVNRDAELNCYAMQSRRRAHSLEVLDETRALWLNATTADLPASCLSLVNAAQAAGVITTEDVWQRIRGALEAANVSQAVQLASRLPAAQALDVAALRQAHRDPAGYLKDVKLDHAPTAQRVTAMFALQRLARQSLELAATRWGQLAAYFPEAERHYFYGLLGYEAARAQDNRALQWYRSAGDVRLSSTLATWRVRAALRQQDWPVVLSGIAAMNAEQQGEGVWRYWKARALKALDRGPEAQPLLLALTGDYGYYGQLAASELDVPLMTAAPDNHQPAADEVNAVKDQTGIRRALALYQLDLRTEFTREWDWALRSYNDRQLLAAAVVAQRSGIYDRSINTAERTQATHDFGLRFPAPYRSELQAHVRDNDLDEALVYGLMRQESRFAPQARSVVGAAGLMQLMPATARWAAQQLGLKDYHKDLIHELSMNLKLGTFYLKTVLTKFDGNPVLALAGYNAGPIRANQWRGSVPLEGAIYIETIPFDETRNYVKKVMSNTVYYSQRFGQTRTTLKQRLGTILPYDKPGVPFRDF